MQSYTFIIKHKKGFTNKVVDALSRRNLTLQSHQLESIGIEAMKGLYATDEDFKEAYQVFVEISDKYHTNFSKFLVQDGLFFKGSLLCVPKGFMRENIIKEKHYGSLAGHFGIDKTMDLVRRFYFWPKLQTEVRKFVESCLVCQRGNLILQMLVFTHHFLFLINLGIQ